MHHFFDRYCSQTLALTGLFPTPYHSLSHRPGPIPFLPDDHHPVDVWKKIKRPRVRTLFAHVRKRGVTAAAHISP